MIYETDPMVNLFSCHAQPEGVVVCMPYQRNMQLGDAFRIVAREGLPEFRGSIFLFEHDLSVDGHFTWVGVRAEHRAMVEPYIEHEYPNDILDAPKLSDMPPRFPRPDFPMPDFPEFKGSFPDFPEWKGA